ncbi:MAG: geranylgeranyl reductase family protein [Luteitalea sp.]|nr:geranylgeranyl reductase family protein [Luteitalea sp.]
MQHFDVAIVGAGPAGAWAAHELARRGARVGLFDASHPREKPCGGGVTRRALALVAPALRMRGPSAVVIEGVRFEASASHRANVALEAQGHDDSSLLVYSRESFDLALVRAAVEAGATWRTERVRDVDVSRDGARLVTSSGTYRSDALIGADGVNSLVRRRLSSPFARGQLSFTTGVFAHGLSASEIVVRFVPQPQGYIWSFPRPDHLALGIGAQADETRPEPLRRILNDWMAEARLTDGARLKPYSWPIPSLNASDLARQIVSGPRWLLVGDAGGLVDPMTREGIYFALRSGELAAEALAAGDESRRYRAALTDEIYPEIEHASSWKRGLFTGPFIHLLVHGLQRSNRVRTVMSDLIAGQQSYRSLKRRLLRTFQIGLAWQLLRIERSSLRSPPASFG